MPGQHASAVTDWRRRRAAEEVEREGDRRAEAAAAGAAARVERGGDGGGQGEGEGVEGGLGALAVELARADLFFEAADLFGLGLEARNERGGGVGEARDLGRRLGLGAVSMFPGVVAAARARGRGETTRGVLTRRHGGRDWSRGAASWVEFSGVGL